MAAYDISHVSVLLDPFRPGAWSRGWSLAVLLIPMALPASHDRHGSAHQRRLFTWVPGHFNSGLVLAQHVLLATGPSPWLLEATISVAASHIPKLHQTVVLADPAGPWDCLREAFLLLR